MQFFDPIQVSQLVTIDREVPPPRHAGQPVDRKANRLIERHPRIEQDERREQRVDERRRQQAEEVAFEQISGNALAQPPMDFPQLAVEPDPPATNARPPAPSISSAALTARPVEKMRTGTGNFGFDAATGQYVDLIEAGIIDPTKVVRLALENAVSVATMTEVPETNPEAAAAGADAGL